MNDFIKEVTVEEIPKFILDDLKSFDWELAVRQIAGVEGFFEAIEMSLVNRNETTRTN